MLTNADLTALAVGLIAERDGEATMTATLATASRLATLLEAEGVRLAEPSATDRPSLAELVRLNGSVARLTNEGRARFDHLTAPRLSA
jgi:hypothetical protein